MIETRYDKNTGTFFSQEAQQIFHQKVIAVIGAGGNGGYLIDYIARLGPKRLIIYDGDTFEESNLNRQLYCTKDTLGINKALATKQQLQKTNDRIIVDAFPKYFKEPDADYLIQEKVDIVLRCIDIFVNIDDVNKGLYKCLQNGIFIIDSLLHDCGAHIIIYNPKDKQAFIDNSKDQSRQVEKLKNRQISQPAFLCALSASMAINEATKILTTPVEKFSLQDSYQLVFDLFENKMHLCINKILIY